MSLSNTASTSVAFNTFFVDMFKLSAIFYIIGKIDLISSSLKIKVKYKPKLEQLTYFD